LSKGGYHYGLGLFGLVGVAAGKGDGLPVGAGGVCANAVGGGDPTKVTTADAPAKARTAKK
jgi:hypothetical protein